jgi:two-component system, cell cycle sensor histidine kinase and response regulator CckA
MAQNIEGSCWRLNSKTLAAVYVSPAFDAICECVIDRRDAKAYQAHIHPADAERVLQALTEFNPTTRLEQEFRIVSSSGAVKWVLANVSSRKNADGQFMTIVNMTVDTSTRKRMEEESDEGDPDKPGRDLIWAHNLDGTLVSFNRTAAEILGYSRDEIRNTTMRQLIPMEAYNEFDNYLSRIRAKGSASGLMRMVTKTGQRRIWEYSNTLRTHGVIEPIVRGLAYDVTDQKRTEEALRISEKNFSQVFMGSPLAIAITTLDDGEFVDVNQVFERQTGFRRSEIIGKSVSKLDVWIDAGQQSYILEEIRARGSIRSQEVQFRSKSGAIQTKLYSADTIEMRGKQCLLTVLEDITQRKIAEQTLKQLEASYRSLFLDSPCGMYRIALDGSFLFVNNALVELLGYDSTEELLSRNLEEDIYAIPEERYHILDNLQHMNPLKSVEVHWRRKDGALILVRAHARGWVNNQLGQIIGLETMVEDITQQRTLEERLRQMQKMESLALLAGGVAHDFNNILTAVLGYGQLALNNLNRTKAEAQISMVSARRELDLLTLDKARAQLRHIVDAATHGQALTAQLLAFSRDESLPIYPLNLDAEIKNISEMIRRLIGEHIRVHIYLGCDSQAILGEIGAFSQVILNLCVNARDAMPKGGRLTVRTFSVSVKLACEEHAGIPPGSYVVLEVADTGCGMSKIVQERIFEPFFTTKATGGGTGLGLYNVYAIVHRCGGHIRMQSEPSRGSTFWLYLPVVDSSPAQFQSVPIGRSQKLGNGTVMVVEDDDRVREIVAAQLESLGFQVLCEANAAAAIQHYDERKEDIEFLVTDVVMPGLDGRALARKLKERQPNLRVLYITGWAPADLSAPWVLGQGAELLRKPFNEDSFSSAVQKLLHHPESMASEVKMLSFAAEASARA